LVNKLLNSRNADAFREFLVKLYEKEAVQNQFITMACCPWLVDAVIFVAYHCNTTAPGDELCTFLLLFAVDMV